MPSVFITADTHFGHQGMCTFLARDGQNTLRPWKDAEQMNQDMVEYWNQTVKPKDKVYHLGDVVINRKFLPILEQLNGDKVLIRGNHDIFRDTDYRKYFRELRAYHVMNGMILSHIPLHPASLSRFGVNIHGHLHDNRVMVDGTNDIDVRYHCVSVEHTLYRPILFEHLMKKITNEGGVVGFKNGNQKQNTNQPT